MVIGTKGRVETVVNESNTAKAVCSGTLDVFATPNMIGLMEQAAQMSVAEYLEEGQGTVGTKIDVTHDAATPLGMKVWAESELVEVDRRRLVFEVAAYDECGLIGKGRHERFIIQNNKFLAKVNAKAVK
ncbi:MAG: thioesterase family protein [Bacillota bacterium]|nr:thioesterase family protein [Bacillota bacterium]